MLMQRRLFCAPAEPDSKPSHGAQGDAPIVPVLDAAALQSLRELDPTGKNQLLQRVFAAFQTSTARLMPQLVESQRTADLAGMRHVAHTLKSSAASVGGTKVSAICADLESQIRRSQTGDLKPQVESLIVEVEALLIALQRLSEADR